jgi:homoserine acetyltransferase
MVDLQHRLLVDGLGVNHARLVTGTSMGGMHTWLWGQLYPDFMDALMPLASVPGQISGRNRVWRRVLIDAIRSDPAWQGNTRRSRSLRAAAQMLWLISSNPVASVRPTVADAGSRDGGVSPASCARAMRTTSCIGSRRPATMTRRQG